MRHERPCVPTEGLGRLDSPYLRLCQPPDRADPAPTAPGSQTMISRQPIKLEPVTRGIWSSDKAPVAAKGAGADREADHIRDRGRQP